MKSLSNSSLFFPLLAIILISSYFRSATALTDCEKSKLKTYIVHVHPPESTALMSPTKRNNWYMSFLHASVASSLPESRMVHAYTHVLSGFAARLTEDELKRMSKADGFIHAHPTNHYSLHTTYTPEFLGLDSGLETGLWNRSNLGKGIVVGVVDSGIDPTHPSFDDVGMPPPPIKWKGRCDYNASACNNKLIGARSFFAGAAKEVNITRDVKSPFQLDTGHGTHVSSTAAGAFVPGVEATATGRGVASGMAPLAHIAIYKVCGFGATPACIRADILAGIDAAVADGVDVLSLSVGVPLHVPFYKDELAVAAFRAIKKGVFPSCAAGNYGPDWGTLANEAPWLLTVAASTTGRRMVAEVKLGSGVQFDGESFFQPKEFKPDMLPLVYAGAGGMPDSSFCGNGSLDGLDVKGKIVLCEQDGDVGLLDKGGFVKNAGGAAIIIANTGEEAYSLGASLYVLPASLVSFVDGSEIKKYINTTANPTATILFHGAVVDKGVGVPAIASFSSRGPSIVSPGILKPDVTAPGVSILAAWPPSLRWPWTDDNRVLFAPMSGTSMAAPHVSGIVALIKSVHPDWSPAAIKSAIMTTADVLDRGGGKIVDERRLPADLFACGAGHVNPTKASDPGLVYDLCADDYIPYLCGLGYNNTQVEKIVGRPIDCLAIGSIAEAELNYPSISLFLGSGNSTVVVLTRTVKNVGEAGARYWAEVEMPAGALVSVEPRVLEFKEVNQELKFKVTVTRIETNVRLYQSEGYLNWVSKKRLVRSPISILF